MSYGVKINKVGVRSVNLLVIVILFVVKYIGGYLKLVKKVF